MSLFCKSSDFEMRLFLLCFGIAKLLSGERVGLLELLVKEVQLVLQLVTRIASQFSGY